LAHLGAPTTRFQRASTILQSAEALRTLDEIDAEGQPKHTQATVARLLKVDLISRLAARTYERRVNDPR
jgi:hypothetical protein